MNIVKIKPLPLTLDDLAEQFQRAKEDEAAAKERRLEVEGQIVAAMTDLKEEGTTTEKTDYFKVSVTTKLTRTLDYPAYLDLESQIPEGIRCVTLKPEIDLKKLRAMEMVRPGFSAQFVTTKPSKPTIKVEAI